VSEHPSERQLDQLLADTPEAEEPKRPAPEQPKRPRLPFSVFSGRELLERRIEPPEKACGFFSMSELLLIVAWRGVGKTHVGLGLTVAIASAGTFLGWESQKARRVLYVDGELPLWTLQERLKLACAAIMDARPENVTFVSAAEERKGFDFASPPKEKDGKKLPNDRDRIEEIIAALAIEVLLLDSLSTLCRYGEENTAESWQEVQDWLVSLRARGLLVIVLHHTGKRKDEQRGTSKREDVFDWSLLLKQPTDYQPADGARFEVTFGKARPYRGAAAVASFEAKLGADEHGRPVWATKPTAEARDELIRKLHAEGETVRDIAKRVGISPSTVGRVVKEKKP
jgi:AAA domain/Helix-turn-helix domain